MQTVIEIVKILFVFLTLMSVVPVLVYLERKISAGIQGRIGPNRVGPLGLLQPLADAIKLIFKEDLIPAQVDRFLYVLAPIMVFIPPALAFAVIPFGNKIQIGDYTTDLQIADLGIGILFVIAVLSMGVYGIAYGGWASNNKFSLLGGLRSSAQMISYELTLGLAIIAVIMVSGSVGMQKIVEHQTDGLWSWNVFHQPLAFILFVVAAFAETNRLPFDLPEAEAELVGGYHTEYAGMRFSIFFMGEYLAMITMSGLITTLFLGGWYFPGITDPHDKTVLAGLLSMGVFAAKMGAILFTFIWVRWTLPRFKYNQLMSLGWKAMLPLAFANIVVTGLVVVLLKK